MRNRTLLPWVLLAVVVIGAVAVAAWPDSGEKSDRSRVADLTAELRCPDCEGLAVADSSTSSARAIRTDVRDRVRDGESDEEIRQAYVDIYGESILLNPEGDGLGLIVWGLPVVALVLGAAGLVFALRRSRGEPRLHATDADEELVGRARDAEG